jgi:acetoin utilization deacetylase AcuC-like enzyme
MNDEFDQLVRQLEDLSISSACCYVYDEVMTEHVGDKNHPERPDRVRTIHEHLTKLGLLEGTLRLPSRLASREEVCLAHSPELVDKLFSFQSEDMFLLHANEDDLVRQKKQYLFPFDHDTYVCHRSVRAARTACGSVLSAVDAITEGKATKGFAAIRPPGHHASRSKSMGFCLINNVAVAAEYAIQVKNMKNVAIIDWDVHHGNGTSDIFHNSKNVLFISIHRYDKGKFYPGTGHMEDTGSDEGLGFTINLPIDGSYGDEEILFCWNQVVLPALENFNPELVLVSAGFDAAEHDPLGQCRVRCGTYGALTTSLLEKSYKVLLVLEGGYNLHSIAKCAVSCMQALLACDTSSTISSPVSCSSSGSSSIRSVPGGVPKSSAVRMVHQVLKLANLQKNFVQSPLVVPQIEYPSFLHSGAGHAGAVERAANSAGFVTKKTSFREALCYALIGEAVGVAVPVETEDFSLWESELEKEKLRIGFSSMIPFFKRISNFTCECKLIKLVSLDDVILTLKDVTFGLVPDHTLGVLDIKLGTEYHTPDHSPNRVATRRQKALSTSASSLGIRLTAGKSLDGFSLSKRRAGKLKTIEQMVPVIRRFLFASMDDLDTSIDAACTCCESLKSAFENTALKFIASSLLLVIGKSTSDLKNFQLRCRLIDLAHLYPKNAAERDDENGFLKGCASLIVLLNQAREPSYESA